MNSDANHVTPASPAVPPRPPLAQLAGRGAASPALLRIVGQSAPQHGPGRVAVAAFQSSV